MRLLFIVFCVVSLPVLADDQRPLEITADKALEWNQTDKTYIARTNTMAKQGDISVKADLLTASYAGVNGSTSDITTLTAEGNVILSTATDTATGDKAVYDVTTGQVTLSGSRPKITQNNKNTLQSDQIIVWTKNSEIDHAEALGNVVIMNGQQTATGDKATYHNLNSMAELIGHVKIKQDNNLLEGDRAEINLKTRISKITGQSGTGRVKGVFYTGNSN